MTGLSHRQTLKALKARKESERERARSRNVVVEGDDSPRARSSLRQPDVNDNKGPCAK